jgi:hypothetical protein
VAVSTVRRNTFIDPRRTGLSIVAHRTDIPYRFSLIPIIMRLLNVLHPAKARKDQPAIDLCAQANTSRN